MRTGGMRRSEAFVCTAAEADSQPRGDLLLGVILQGSLLRARLVKAYWNKRMSKEEVSSRNLPFRVRMEGAALCYGFLDHGFFFWKLFPIRKMTYQHEVWLRSSGVQLDCLFKRNDSLRNLAWSVQLDVCRCDRCLQRVASDCTEPSQVGLRLLDVYCGMCLSNKLGTWVEHRHR